MNCKCGGNYDEHPYRCDECCRYMDDCDGADETNERIEREENEAHRAWYNNNMKG